jgi:hypothetical protein
MKKSQPVVSSVPIASTASNTFTASSTTTVPSTVTVSGAYLQNSNPWWGVRKEESVSGLYLVIKPEEVAWSNRELIAYCPTEEDATYVATALNHVYGPRPRSSGLSRPHHVYEAIVPVIKDLASDILSFMEATAANENQLLASKKLTKKMFRKTLTSVYDCLQKYDDSAEIDGVNNDPDPLKD